jgi:hypothetical protein
MRTFLLAATMMVPFAAFAGGSGLSVASDVEVDAARDTEAGVVQPSRAVD